MLRELRGLHIDAALADRLDRYAKERGLGREHIVETALMQLFARIDNKENL